MIRPTVSQSIRSIRLIVVLSALVASHATRHSKSRVNSDPARANGTPSVRAPCSGHHNRRRRQWTSSRQTPRSKCRHTESSGRVSFRAAVEYPHSGQISRRRLSATSTITLSGSNRTFCTHTPGRRRSLENAVVTRTLSLLASR
jgi:hypothetical protein